MCPSAPWRPALAIDPSSAFVSYSREDWEFVLRLAEDLKARGAKVWMDKLDIRAGQRWEREVETAVRGCSRMLVILSPTSVGSSNVLAEAAFAIDEGKEVIPVLYQECEIPFRLRPFQYADFRTSYDEGLQELLATLGSVRAAAETAAPTAESTAIQAAALTERERMTAEKKTRQEELERQRLATEQARLEEEQIGDRAEKTDKTTQPSFYSFKKVLSWSLRVGLFWALSAWMFAQFTPSFGSSSGWEVGFAFLTVLLFVLFQGPLVGVALIEIDPRTKESRDEFLDRLARAKGDPSVGAKGVKPASFFFVWPAALIIGGLVVKALPHLEPRMHPFVFALVYYVVGGALTGAFASWSVTSMKSEGWDTLLLAAESFLVGAASFGVGPLLLFLTGTQQSGIRSIPCSFLSGTVGTGAVVWFVFFRQPKR